MVKAGVILLQLIIPPETFPSSSINSRPVSVTSLPATLKSMESRIHFHQIVSYIMPLLCRDYFIPYIQFTDYFTEKSCLHNIMKIMMDRKCINMSLINLSLISLGQLTPICWRMTSSVTWPSSRTWTKIPEQLLSRPVIGHGWLKLFNIQCFATE